jgi:hypothetical protein
MALRAGNGSDRSTPQGSRPCSAKGAGTRPQRIDLRDAGSLFWGGHVLDCVARSWAHDT